MSFIKGFNFALLLGATVFNSACIKKEDNSPKQSPLSPTTDLPTSTGSLQLPTEPSDIFEYVDTGLKSALVAGADNTSNATTLSMPGTLAIAPLNLDPVPSDPNFGSTNTAPTENQQTTNGGGSGSMPITSEPTKYCNEIAEPISSDPAKNFPDFNNTPGLSAAMRQSDPDYAAGKLLCLLSYPHGESPDTASGAYAVAKMFTCLTKNKLTFDGQSHILEEVDLAKSPCLLKSLKAMLPPDQPIPVTPVVVASKPAAFGGSGWDYSLEIKDINDPVPFKFLFKSSEGIVAVSGLMAPEEAKSAPNPLVDAFSVFINPNDGLLRYEGRFKREVISSNPYVRHMRMLAKGKVTENGSFSSLTSYSGVYSNVALNQPNGDRGELYTVSGNTSKGFRTASYQCDNNTCNNFSSVTDFPRLPNDKNCYGGDGTCSGVSTITISSQKDLGFLLHPMTNPPSASSESWFSANPPLSFLNVSLEEK